MDDTDFYKNLKENAFDQKCCFLCGKVCGSETAEHIFPKWLQRKFNLWDKNLIISNNSTIPYRNLTVPCCKICNGTHLSGLEKKFKEILENSFENLTPENEKTIFQWTGKILYATRYKELSLLIDRQNPNLGKILSPKELESYSALHLFLQLIRFKTTFNNPKPWSIFTFKCDNEDFFYHNNLSSLCLSMKFGKVSLTIVYEDNNIITNFMGIFKQLGHYEINFAQYLEINAHIFYSASLKENVPTYFSYFNEINQDLTVKTVGNIRSRRWNDQEYCANFDYLLTECGIEINGGSYHKDGTITTFLIDKDDKRLITNN